ncbi:MAG: M56 family metallopeptidase [Verrucomicrobiota bacterium]
MNAPAQFQFVEAWGEALGRASWQGAVVIAVVWLVCRAWPTMPGRLRWWLWQVAMLKLLIGLWWAAPIELAVLPPKAEPAPVAVGTASEGSYSAGFAAEPVGAALPQSAPGVRPDWKAALILLWLLGVGWGVARLGREWRRALRMRSLLEPVENEPAIEMLHELSQRLGLRRAPALAQSDEAPGPLLLGAWRPVIVLPRALARDLDRAKLRLALAHELAHVRRCDLLWNWLPLAAQTLFFFHPLVWVAHRQWRLAREMACDEEAVLAVEADPADYAVMLADAVERRNVGPAPGVFAMGVVESGQAMKTLKWRIHAMKYIRPYSRRRLLGLAAAITTALALGVVPWRLVAQAARPEAEEKERAARAQQEQVEKRKTERVEPESQGTADPKPRKVKRPTKEPESAGAGDPFGAGFAGKGAKWSAPVGLGDEGGGIKSAQVPEAAKAELEVTRAELAAVQAKVKRVAELFEQKRASQAERENAEAELAHAQAKVKLAEARLRDAGKNAFDSGGKQKFPPEGSAKQRLREIDMALALRQYERVQMEAFEAGLQRDLMSRNGLKDEEVKQRYETLERTIHILRERAEGLRQFILDFEQGGGAKGK